MVLPLYSAAAQVEGGQERSDDPQGIRELTVDDAIEDGVIGDPWIGYYLGISLSWYERIGVDMDRFRYRQHRPAELSHYAADCWDAEAEIAGDWIEITGFAYRGAYDLSKHDQYSEEDYSLFKQYDEPRTVERATVDPDMSYLGPEFGDRAGDVAGELEALAGRTPDAFEDDYVTVEVENETVTIPTEETGFAVEEVTESGEHLMPHVVEPSFGVGRLVYTILVHNHGEDEVDGETRDYLALPPSVAPTIVGVFPLMDRDGLGERAQEIVGRLRDRGFAVTYDESGSIGRRYRRQDEVGTPYCVTVDYDTLEDDTVTIRDRDTARQRRVPAEDLPAILADLREGERGVEAVGTELPDAGA